MERKDDNRNCYMLRGLLAWKGYDWWWHSFTGTNASTGEERQFFIEYYIMNPKRGGEQPEFGLDGKKKPAYVMIKAGEWGGKGKQLHRFFGTKELECDTDELRVVVGDCFLSETVLKGNVTVSEETACSHPEYMSDAGSMSWLLQVDKKTEYQVGYGASALFRKLNAFQMYWHAAGMRTEYNGTVFFDGERYSISSSTSYGYADKNWGTDFTNPWIWLAGCSITSRLTNEPLNDTSFDFGGGCPKIFGIPMKENLLGKIRYKGKDYEFNFSKFWTFSQTKFRCKETEKNIVWHVRLASLYGAVEIRAVCPKQEMLLMRYQAPDGSRKHDRLWNGGTARAEIKLYRRSFGRLRLVDEMTADRVGCEWGTYN